MCLLLLKYVPSKDSEMVKKVANYNIGLIFFKRKMAHDDNR